jgi:hypothetical protein
MIWTFGDGAVSCALVDAAKSDPRKTTARRNANVRVRVFGIWKMVPPVLLIMCGLQKERTSIYLKSKGITTQSG